jgi:hypothetical protein
VAAWRWSWPRKTTRFSAGREGISERDIEAGRRAAATSTETIPAKPSSPVRTAYVDGAGYGQTWTTRMGVLEREEVEEHVGKKNERQRELVPCADLRVTPR